MRDSDHGWTPLLVWLNTLATVLAGLTGVAALIIALVALARV